MRILTMLTVLFFCGNIFAQNSAGESAFGATKIELSIYNNISYTVDASHKGADHTAEYYAFAMAALPLELANSISTSEFIANLRSPIASDIYPIAHQVNIDLARAMAVYSPEMASQMVGIIPIQKSLSGHQLAKVKVEEKTNS